jgi:hypothetical protein
MSPLHFQLRIGVFGGSRNLRPTNARRRLRRQLPAQLFQDQPMFGFWLHVARHHQFSAVGQGHMNVQHQNAGKGFQRLTGWRALGTVILTKLQARPASLCAAPNLCRSVSRFQGRWRARRSARKPASCVKNNAKKSQNHPPTMKFRLSSDTRKF